jgi:DNA-directed RNA polymerase subunit E'/Rpb7
MDFQLVSPYKNTIQYTKIMLLPSHMNSDIESNMEVVLKQKVEKKCNKYGFIDKVYSIDYDGEGYSEEIITAENFSGGAIYRVAYQCRMCLPIEQTVIIMKVHSINSELIITNNGPLICFIPKTNIDTSIWELTNVLTHRKQNTVLTPDEYVKVIVVKKQINQFDTKIKLIGIISDYASKKEVATYFGSIVEEEKEEDNFIM